MKTVYLFKVVYLSGFVQYGLTLQEAVKIKENNFGSQIKTDCKKILN